MLEPGSLIYLKGDATKPVDTGGLRVIVHCCNNVGAWGAGFVLSLSKKWEAPEKKFRENYEVFQPALGHVGLVPVEADIVVCNLVGQEGVGEGEGGRPPIRYDAIDQGLKNLGGWLKFWPAAQAFDEPVSVHMPRMGSGLAGGDWRVIEALVLKHLVDQGIDVYVYDYTPIRGESGLLMVIDDPHLVEDLDPKYQQKVREWAELRKQREQESNGVS